MKAHRFHSVASACRFALLPARPLSGHLFRSPATLVAVAAIVLAGSAPCRVEAAWPHDPGSGNVPVASGAGNQQQAAIIPDGSGGVIVAWRDDRSGNTDIYAQRINSAGAPVWTANGVAVCTATGSQFSPALCSDGAGGAIITWQDSRGLDDDIYAQRLNATGATQWPANGVPVCTATGQQLSPEIVTDDAGGAIIAWQDNRGGFGNSVAYAQRINPSGVTQWGSNGALVATSVYVSGVLYNVRIAEDGGGGAFLTFVDAGGASQSLRAQRVGPTGVPLWSSSNSLTPSWASPGQQSMAPDGTGGIIVAWQENSGLDANIGAQRMDGLGNVLWGSLVWACQASGNQIDPVVAADGSGGAIVAWQDFRSLVHWQVYAQHVAAGGAVLWPADGEWTRPVASGDQQDPGIVSDGAGGAIVAFDEMSPANNRDIYAQRMTPDGGFAWGASGTGVSLAAADQVSPVLAADGTGGFVLAWDDTRRLDHDLYAQRVESYGRLGNPEASALSVKDVPHDQGGVVKVSWSASYVDAAPGSIGCGVLCRRRWSRHAWRTQ